MRKRVVSIAETLRPVAMCRDLWRPAVIGPINSGTLGMGNANCLLPSTSKKDVCLQWKLVSSAD